jgi:hypothetical protein
MVKTKASALKLEDIFAMKEQIPNYSNCSKGYRMELNLTIEEIRFLQVLLLRNSQDANSRDAHNPDTNNSELQALDPSTIMDDQLLVKIQDALDGWTVSANAFKG